MGILSERYRASKASCHQEEKGDECKLHGCGYWTVRRRNRPAENSINAELKRSLKEKGWEEITDFNKLFLALAVISTCIC